MTNAHVERMRRRLEIFALRAEMSNDLQRLRLLRLFRTIATRADFGEAAKQIEMCDAGIQLAIRLDEPVFELLFWHGKLLARIESSDFRGAVDEATRATALLHSAPDFFMPACTLHDHVMICQAVDGLGYADTIRRLLCRMETELQSMDRCWRCLRWSWIDHFLSLRKHEEASREVMRILAGLHSDALTTAFDNSRRKRDQQSELACYHVLCTIALAQRNWIDLHKWAAECGRCSLVTAPLLTAESGVWKSIALWRDGFESEARRMCRLSWSHVRRSKLVPTAKLWDAFCSFYELRGRLRGALLVRRRQWRVIRDHGMLGQECLCRIEMVRLKHLLRVDIRSDVAESQECAARLINPAVYLSRLHEALESAE